MRPSCGARGQRGVTVADLIAVLVCEVARHATNPTTTAFYVLESFLCVKSGILAAHTLRAGPRTASQVPHPHVMDLSAIGLAHIGHMKL